MSAPFVQILQYVTVLCRHHAGHATQGVPDLQVRRVVITPREERLRKVVWVVYEGVIPGIYDSWYIAIRICLSFLIVVFLGLM